MILDTPPILQVGDAMALSRYADGVIVVARLNLLRRKMLDELARALDNCPTEKLGFVVTGAEADGAHGYGYGYGYTSNPRSKRAAVITKPVGDVEAR